MTHMADAPHLYEQLAADIAGAITRGTLRAGERLPSVRRLSEQRGVSVATVLTAYLSLENEGLIETRPKSGHFVRVRRATALLGPTEPRSRVGAPARVTVGTGVAALLAAMRDPAIVPLGAATLSPELLPIAALNRMMAAICKEMSTAGASYDAPPGLPTLRRQLARRAVTWGAELGEADFITTVGAMEALHIALRATTRPGDAIAVESPTYFGVLQLIEEMGLRAIEIPVHPTSGLDLDALDEALRTQRPRTILCVPNLHNPLATVMSDDAKQRLWRLAQRHDVPIIEDDIHGDLMHDGTRPRPLKAFDRDGRVLLCGSVSKTLAPGYRVGWLAAGRYQDAAERLKFSQSVATPTLPQMAVAEFLASGGYDRHLRRLRRQLSAQVARMREAVAHSFPPGTRVSAPAGGFVLWLELPAGCDALAIQARALERGVAVAPGPIFSARGRFGSCLRLSCGFPWSPRLEAAVATLGALAAAEASRIGPAGRVRQGAAVN